jgi:prepilin-type N-terminal cleavage/methylation domain-containing protein
MKKGFTLIELLVVISIIAVLSSVVLAAVGTARTKGVIAAGQTFEGQMYQAYGANAVAVWSFDEGAGVGTAADSSGNNNTLTINSPSALETATVFRGKSAFSIPAPSSGNPSTANLPTFSATNGSISFWINLIQSSDGAGIFCSSTQYQFCIFDSDAPNNAGHFIGVIWANNSSNTFFTPFFASSYLSKWTNVALSWTYNGTTGTINIYINGSQVATKSYNPTVISLLSNTFCVGGDCQDSNLDGYLDEMRVYSQSLQTGEIQKIYAEELPHYEHLLADAHAHSQK